MVDPILVINANKPPTYNYIPPIVTPMIGNSTIFSLGGTDSDPADTLSTLKVVIDQIPSRGTLVQVGGGDVLTIGQLFSNGASFYLRGGALKDYDEFVFHVVDGIRAIIFLYEIIII